MSRVRLALAGAFVLLGLSYLCLRFIEMAEQVAGSGSGGIGAVSLGCFEALVDLFPIIATQVALKIAERKGLIGTRIRRWHAIGAVLLIVFLIVAWPMTFGGSRLLTLFPLFVVYGQWACLFLAIAVLIRGRQPK